MTDPYSLAFYYGDEAATTIMNVCSKCHRTLEAHAVDEIRMLPTMGYYFTLKCPEENDD